MHEIEPPPHFAEVDDIVYLLTMDNLDLLTTSQVAAELQYPISTVTRLVKSGAIPIEGKLPGRTGAYLFNPVVIQQMRRRRAEEVCALAAKLSAVK